VAEVGDAILERATLTAIKIAEASEKLRDLSEEISRTLNVVIAHGSGIWGVDRLDATLAVYSRVPEVTNQLTLDFVCRDMQVELKLTVRAVEALVDVPFDKKEAVHRIVLSDVKVGDVVWLAMLEKCNPGALNKLEEALSNIVNGAEKTIETLKTIIAMAKMLQSE